MDYTRLTNLEVTGDLKIGAVKSSTDIAEVAAAAGSAPTAAEFKAAIDVLNALTALLGRPTT